ncbi:NAD(P)-dependent oxidoreductase [Winogradskyella sp. ECml5-4]|uniref:NAD-dependent epimerase/dehydratase family protein n=1 Tax=Winogradskyella sp. ECml5-4 TaxID=3110975 RepID=UPI002FF0E1C4
MKASKHIVIGSNSFLGNILSKKIADKNLETLGVFHKNTNNLYEGINHIPISKLKNLKTDIDVVYIVSAFVPKPTEKVIKQKLFEVNQQLVADICKQFKNSKIVYCSSVSVYKSSEKKVNEESILSPKTLYGESKRLGEDIVKKHKDYAIVRISSMYGVNMKPTTFLPLIIKSALKNNQIKLYGNGKRQQNYIHVNDVADYLIAASYYPKNDVFLAVNSMSISNIVVANTVKDFLENINIKFQGEDNSKSYFYDNTQTNSKLKLKPKKEFKIEVKNVIEWMKKEL